MKTIVPDYYKKFTCIAERCRHNCCIGWEIDIDEDTERRYLSISRNENSELAVKMRESIAWSTRRMRRKGKNAAFRLSGEDERCPFLTEQGLCEIILEKGPEALCQICADHPRFVNEYGDHLETGLGLVCEEACRLVLLEKEPPRYEILPENPERPEINAEESTGTPAGNAGNDGETAESSTGTPAKKPEEGTDEHALKEEIVAEYRKCISAEDICRIPAGEIDWPDWAGIFLSLERLNDAWTEMLTELKENADCPDYEGFESDFWKNVFERFKEYLLYRHFMEYGRDFCELLWNLVLKIANVRAFLTGSMTFEDFAEIVRIYSGEIEYSDENREIIINELEY